MGLNVADKYVSVLNMNLSIGWGGRLLSAKWDSLSFYLQPQGYTIHLSYFVLSLEGNATAELPVLAAVTQESENDDSSTLLLFIGTKL